MTSNDTWGRDTWGQCEAVDATRTGHQTRKKKRKHRFGGAKVTVRVTLLDNEKSTTSVVLSFGFGEAYGD